MSQSSEMWKKAVYQWVKVLLIFSGFSFQWRGEIKYLARDKVFLLGNKQRWKACHFSPSVGLEESSYLFKEHNKKRLIWIIGLTYHIQMFCCRERQWICFFSFPFITQNIQSDKVRESKTAEFAYTQGLTVWIFCELLPLCSLLLQDWHKAISNHLSFSLLLSTYQLWAVWCKARAQSDMRPSSCLPPVFLVSAGYAIFQMPTQILVVTPHLVCHLCIAHGLTSF